MMEFAHVVVPGMSEFDMFLCCAALAGEAVIVMRSAMMYRAQCTSASDIIV